MDLFGEGFLALKVLSLRLRLKEGGTIQGSSGLLFGKLGAGRVFLFMSLLEVWDFRLQFGHKPEIPEPGVSATVRHSGEAH